MKKSKKTVRVNKQLTQRLLELSLNDNPNKPKDVEAQKEDLLLDTLRSKLPLEHTLPELIQSIARELKTLSGASLGALLHNSDTKIEILIKIKDYAKTQGHDASNHTEREVTLIVYYAAIAAALVYHKRKISEHSHSSLREAFGKLEQTPWIPANLTTLFQEALGTVAE